MTATPQRLRLMLIEGALRFAAHGKQSWQEDRDDLACQSLARCRAVLAELLGTIRGDMSDVAARVRDLYAFLLRKMLEVIPARDIDGLDQIIYLLQIERETWNQVCHQMPEAPVGHGFGKSAEVTAATGTCSPAAQLTNHDPASSGIDAGGFCLDA
jgi:flagellar protein FliS